MIRTTASMITAAGTSIRSVNASPARLHPRKMAITGLTYAYVATLEAWATRNNQTYAEKPMMEPKRLRYATESQERVETDAGSNL